jgi:hypothetical protein
MLEEMTRQKTIYEAKETTNFSRQVTDNEQVNAIAVSSNARTSSNPSERLDFCKSCPSWVSESYISSEVYSDEIREPSTTSLTSAVANGSPSSITSKLTHQGRYSLRSDICNVSRQGCYSPNGFQLSQSPSPPASPSINEFIFGANHMTMENNNVITPTQMHGPNKNELDAVDAMLSLQFDSTNRLPTPPTLARKITLPSLLSVLEYHQINAMQLLYNLNDSYQGYPASNLNGSYQGHPADRRRQMAISMNQQAIEARLA